LKGNYRYIPLNSS